MKVNSDYAVPLSRNREMLKHYHERLREQGIRSVYVVTQAWHMHRAIMAFADTGIAVTAAPPRLDRLSSPLAANLIPEVAGWQESYHALHEWIGCVYYALR